MKYKSFFLYALLLCLFIGSIVFVNHNDFLYKQHIAKVVKATSAEAETVTDMYGNSDRIFKQRITAKLQNGPHKGERIYLSNEYSISGAYDQKYTAGDKLFVSIRTHTQNGELTGLIKDAKRDTNVLIISWIFIFALLVVGKKQGFLSLISLAVNSVLLSYALDMYITTSGTSLLFICGISAILFTFVSLLLVNGLNEKTYAAMLATLLGTFIALLIMYLVMKTTGEKGLRYEEMQFLTRPPRVVFMAGILIGSLGAVMDVAITMCASMFELYEKNRDITVQALKTSGKAIGRDIMGPMTNILFFAYISGSIPMLILYIKNHAPLGYTFSMNLSLELARALAGGIGIVLTVPLALYISIFFIERKRRTA
ncbi:YibE/F family protein [Ectobacillus sp. JY-23]|uniref:YibE/F family protein n=1 Tax=Ectobacillus sp. JY-23 TaxID=2933872 RepID=UPI001FF4E407|nr:YibE/F family protein [Ectobacillus sp. JY-23]UOY92261.1 YibE/F family protein [Ectobacillus sp. JY-23]